MSAPGKRSRSASGAFCAEAPSSIAQMPRSVAATRTGPRYDSAIVNRIRIPAARFLYCDGVMPSEVRADS